MSFVIALASVGAYVVVAAFAGGLCASWVASAYEPCSRGEWMSICKEFHRKGCRQPIGVGPTSVAVGTLAGIVWPLLVMPLIVAAVAVRNPMVGRGHSRDLAARIAAAEKELGIGQ